MTRGIEDPDRYYYRRLMTDAVRAVDAVRALPDIDPRASPSRASARAAALAIAAAGWRKGSSASCRTCRSCATTAAR